MHTNSLPPSDRDEAPASKPLAVRPCNVELRDRLRTLRDAENSKWSNAKISKQLGVNEAQVSRYLNDDGCKYDGNIQGLEIKIGSFLEAEERRLFSDVDTLWHDGYAEAYNAFRFIVSTNDIGAIIAEPGEGKTRMIEGIREKHPLAMLFRASAWNNDKYSLMGQLWEVVPHNGYDNRTKRPLFIVKCLKGSNRILIVDDAHKLTTPAIQMLTELQDETRIPIALFATPDLIIKLEAGLGHSQRFSRIGIHYTFNPERKQIESLNEHLVSTLAKDCNGDRAELLSLCKEVAMQHGHFRSVHKQLKLAGELRAATGKGTSWPDAFRNAHTMLLRQYQLEEKDEPKAKKLKAA